LLDIATAEIVIRRNLKEKEKRSALTILRVSEIGDKALEQQIHEGAKSDLPRYKGGIS